MSTALTTAKDKDSLLSKDNLEHSLRIADLLAKTDMTPKAYKNKPNDVLIAMELGRSWGLSPLQAIQNIAVINGKPCAYGDLVLAICSSHPDFENIEEQKISGKDGSVIGYKCTVKRKGRTEVCQSFTLEQARKAGLMDRSPTWKAYPERMLQMRARGFALRDSFADALNGVAIREEVEDYEVKDITPKQKETKSDALMNKLKAAKGQTIDVTPEDEETGEVASPEKMKEVHALIAVKGFNNGRLQKAMEYYGIETLGQLTAKQADHFMAQLNKEADK
jgi:hypothetical protein